MKRFLFCMSYHVNFHAATCSKCFITSCGFWGYCLQKMINYKQRTLKRILFWYEFSCDFSEWILWILRHCEYFFITLITTEWFIFFMNYSKMFNLITTSVIHFLTNVTFILILFSVNWLDVLSDIAFRGITFTTSITFVSFNSGVSNTVTFKTCSIITWKMTFNTSKLFLHWSIKIFTFHVVSKCFVISKNLITRWARKKIISKLFNTIRT